MRVLLVSLFLLPLLCACSQKKEARVIAPVMNHDPYTREMTCDNQPALVKECLDKEMCSKYGEDVMNYSFCRDECTAKVRKSCKKPKAAPPARITAPLPLPQMPTPAPDAATRKSSY